MISAAPVPAMTVPSLGSTVAFVAIVGVVCGLFVWMVRRAFGPGPATARAAVGVAVVLAVTAGLAKGGIVAGLAGSPALMGYLAAWNALALLVALSPVGGRIAQRVPLAALVGFAGFRLPLELVLDQWYDEGVLPVQMTYSGHNFDIVTGIAGATLGLALWRDWIPASWVRPVVWAFNLVGLGLLLAVVRIAVLSSPVPFRSYLEDPPVLLVFHAPYTWILPICVAGALFGHVVTFRALRRPALVEGSARRS